MDILREKGGNHYWAGKENIGGKCEGMSRVENRYLLVNHEGSRNGQTGKIWKGNVK